MNIELENRFLNEFTKGVSRVTDACPLFITFGTIGLLSTILHKYYFTAPAETHLNLFLFLLGPSSVPRKTTIIGILNAYLSEVAPELILPTETTPEALMASLAQQSRGVMFVRELNHFLDQVLGSDYNRGLSSTLGNIYDGGPGITRFTKKDGLIEIRDPALSIVGGGVYEFIFQKIKELDLVSGFWPRVTPIILKDYPSQPWRRPGRFKPLPDILERLRELAAGPGGEISFDKVEPELKTYAEGLFKEAVVLKNPNLAATYSRLEWTLVKIAAILQLADHPGTQEIEPSAFYDAMQLVDYIKKTLPDFYAEKIRESEEIMSARKIEEIIDELQDGDKWVPWHQIFRLLNCNSREAHAAVNRLLEIGSHEEVNIPSQPTTGGRPGKAYRRIKT